MKKIFRKLYASIRGTFIADCPKCHRHFYGSEGYATQVKLDKHYRIVCLRCAQGKN